MRNALSVSVLAVIAVFMAVHMLVSSPSVIITIAGTRSLGEASQYGAIVNITIFFQRPDGSVVSSVITDPVTQDVQVPLNTILINVTVVANLSSALYPGSTDAVQYTRVLYSLTAPDNSVAINTTQMPQSSYIALVSNYHYVRFTTGNINYPLSMSGIYRLTIQYQVWY